MGFNNMKQKLRPVQVRVKLMGSVFFFKKQTTKGISQNTAKTQ